MNPKAQMAEKQPYGVGALQEIKIPMLMKIKNLVKWAKIFEFLLI